MKNETREIRIPKEDWGQFCWECYLRGYNIITGGMTKDGEVIVLSGVPKLRAEEFADDIRFANDVRTEQRLSGKAWRIPRSGPTGPTVTGGEHGNMPDGDRLDHVEVIESEKEHGGGATDES